MFAVRLLTRGKSGVLHKHTFNQWKVFGPKQSTQDSIVVIWITPLLLHYYGSHLHGSHLYYYTTPASTSSTTTACTSSTTTARTSTARTSTTTLLRLAPPVLPLNSSNIQFPTESIYTYLNNPLLDKPLKRFCPTPYICGVTANTVGTSRSTPPPLAVPMQMYITSDPTVQLLSKFYNSITYNLSRLMRSSILVYRTPTSWRTIRLLVLTPKQPLLS